MEKINLYFEYYDVQENTNKKVAVKASIYDNVVNIAHDNDIPIEASCGCSLACSTCHVVCEPHHYNEDDISDEEDALLDCAYGREETSRLGCQIKLNTSHNNMILKVPKNNKNFT